MYLSDMPAIYVTCNSLSRVISHLFSGALDTRRRLVHDPPTEPVSSGV